MKLVMLESPFAGEVEENIEYARKCMAHSLSLGEAPIASHLIYTQKGILDDDIQAERDKGIAAGLYWGHQADMIAVYTDRGISGGMQQAIDHYSALGKAIEFRQIL